MPTMHRHALLLCVLFPLWAQAAGTPALRYDHYNPVALNEFALRQALAGDTRSALILLERAHLLAPHDTRIAHNLELLRAGGAGPVASAAAVEAAATPMQDCCAEPLPGALWKR